MAGLKKHNEYERMLAFYDSIPKSVLAAIAVSFAAQIEGDIGDAHKAILNEWRVLHENGIVPQPPLHGDL